VLSVGSEKSIIDILMATETFVQISSFVSFHDTNMKDYTSISWAMEISVTLLQATITHQISTGITEFVSCILNLPNLTSKLNDSSKLTICASRPDELLQCCTVLNLKESDTLSLLCNVVGIFSKKLDTLGTTTVNYISALDSMFKKISSACFQQLQPVTLEDDDYIDEGEVPTPMNVDERTPILDYHVKYLNFVTGKLHIMFLYKKLMKSDNIVVLNRLIATILSRMSHKKTEIISSLQLLPPLLPRIWDLLKNDSAYNQLSVEPYSFTIYQGF
jgi:hypothetical protein